MATGGTLEGEQFRLLILTKADLSTKGEYLWNTTLLDTESKKGGDDVFKVKQQLRTMIEDIFTNYERETASLVLKYLL